MLIILSLYRFLICLQLQQYTKRSNGFDFRTVLRKNLERTPVGCSHLLTSIDCFNWSIIFFLFMYQDFLCWLLNCVFWLLYQCSFIPILVLSCDTKKYFGRIQRRYMHLIPLQDWWRSWSGCRLCGCNFYHKHIDWM